MEHIDEKVGLEEGIATMPDEKQCFRVSMECVFHLHYLEEVLLGEASIESPGLPGLDNFNDSL